MEFAAIHLLLQETLGDAVVAAQPEGIEPYLTIAAPRLAEVARLLREDPRLEFDLLMCLSGVDWDGYDAAGKGKSVAILGYQADGSPERSDRVATAELGVVYHLYSYRHRHKLTLHVRMPRDAAEVPTVSRVWPTAGWHEREVWDLLGIRFAGHSDLRRILLEESWVGHPLRKDYQMPDQWEEVPLQGQPYSELGKPPPPPPAPTPPPAAPPGSPPGSPPPTAPAGPGAGPTGAGV